MKKRVLCIFIAVMFIVAIIPANAASVGNALYETYIKDGDMSDFWTVIAAASLGYECSTTAAVSELSTSLDIAKVLLAKKASKMPTEEETAALVACVGENGSIENDNDNVGGVQCASTQAMCIIALETVGADYDREAAVSFLFSQQCENGGLGWYEYDDVSTSCWSMVAYMMSGVSGFDGNVSKLQTYIESSVRDDLVYEYGAPNFWSTASYIWYLEVKQSRTVFDVYDAFMESFFDGSSFTVDYQPQQGVVAVGCFTDGCIFTNLRDGTTGTQVVKKKPGSTFYPIPLPDPKPVEETPAKTFPDIVECPEREAIEALYTAGYIGGDAKGNFRPNDRLTRAEALQMFYAISGKTAVYSGGFSDVNQDSWYASAAEYCRQAGIAGGYDGKLRPDDDITAEEFALMCERAGYKVETVTGESVTRAQAAAVISSNIK